MTERHPADFVPTAFDAEKAELACRTLIEADEAGSGGEHTDSNAVANALAHAVEAFPGLQEFAEMLEDDGAELDDLGIVVEGLAGGDGPLVRAVAKMAVAGAKAEIDGGFEWSDIDDCLPLCRSALGASGGPAAPGPR